MYSALAFIDTEDPAAEERARADAGPAIDADCGHVARHAIRVFSGAEVVTTCAGCWRRQSKQRRSAGGVLAPTLTLLPGAAAR